MFDFSDFEEWLFWQYEKTLPEKEQENFNNLNYMENNE